MIQEVAIFSFSKNADGVELAIAMSLLVSFIMFAQYSLAAVDSAVSKTAFSLAIQSLYKELVVMGLTGFILSLLQASGMHFGTWHVYLQISDLTLFVSTILHVVFSMGLMFANGLHMRKIRDTLARDVHALVKQYREYVPSRWALFSSLRSKMELRVLHVTFLKNFNLSRSFDFARYITIAEESNIVHMLEVHKSLWFCYLVFMIAVCLGFSLNGSDQERYRVFLSHQCRDFEVESSFNDCTVGTYQCLVFVVSSGIMLIFTMCLATASRMYVLRLLYASGCDMDALDIFLLDDERSDLKDELKGRISFKELKSALEKIKTSAKVSKARRRTSTVVIENLTNRTSRLWKKAQLVKAVVNIGADPFEKDRVNTGPKVATAPLKSPSMYTIFSEHNTPVNSSPPSPKSTNSHNSSMTDILRSDENIKYKPSIMDASSVKRSPHSQTLPELSPNMRKSSAAEMSEKVNLRKVQLLEGGIKSGIFLFDSPYLYFWIRDLSNLLLCLVLSLYLMTFGPIAGLTSNPALWAGAPLLLLLAALVCQSYTIRSSSLIFSFYKLDPEVLGRVIEEKEEIANIERLLREKLLNKIMNATDDTGVPAEVALMQLFNEIQSLDGEEDGAISPNELRVLLHRLNIHFTARRFDDAFSLMDVHADGFITLMEFHAFIFPSDATEKSRIQRLQKMAEIGHMELPEDLQQLLKKKQAVTQNRRGRRTNVTILNTEKQKKDGSSGLLHFLKRSPTITEKENEEISPPSESPLPDTDSPPLIMTKPSSLNTVVNFTKKIFRGKKQTYACDDDVENGTSQEQEDPPSPVLSPERSTLTPPMSTAAPNVLAKMQEITSGDAWNAVFSNDKEIHVEKPAFLIDSFVEDGNNIEEFERFASIDSGEAPTSAERRRVLIEGGGNSFRGKHTEYERRREVMLQLEHQDGEGGDSLGSHDHFADAVQAFDLP